jgi:hypothetical protein
MFTRNHSRVSTVSRQFLLAIVILCPLISQAGESIQTVLLDSFEFESEVEAVKAMKEHCLAESKRENAEHVGAILQTGDGRFLVTHGKADPQQESVTFSIRRPASSTLVALWHTHGAPGRQTERFSIQDGQTVRDTGLPFYLITPKGDIKLLVKDVKGQPVSERGASSASERTFVRKFKGLTLFRLI